MHRLLSRFELVGHVGQESDLTGSLDGLGELTLMHGANAGRAARQDLAALGHEAAKLGGVLVVDVGRLVNAELANFSALAVLGVVLIESQSCILLISISERQLAVAVIQLHKGVRVCGRRAAAGVISAAVAALGVGGVAVRVIAAVVVGTAGVAVAAALAEVDVVRDDLPAGAVVSVAILPLAGLQAAGNDDHTALVEVLGHKLASGAPGDAVDEIGLPLAAVAPAEIAVDRNGEAGDTDAGLRGTQLGITGQTAHDNNVVEHIGTSYSARRVIRRRMMPSVMPRIRSSSAGKSGPLVNFMST